MKLSQLSNFYSPWNHQEKISIPPEIISELVSVPPEIFKKPLMISGGI